MKLTKKRKKVASMLEPGKTYTLAEAAALVKKVNTASFDSSVDLHILLGVDPKKADQSIRGTVSLPHGSGKTKTVLVFCAPDKEQEAKDAGADYVGLDDMMQKIEKENWLDFDVVIATPTVMPKIAKLGRVLGPRNLMPNPKVGTVTDDIANAVSEVKKGKVSFRIDKQGIVHSSIGRVSFSENQIAENAAALIHTIEKMRPSTTKGQYMKSVTLASTMSPGIHVDLKTLVTS
jgi:large subunit ribosomal protein L1